MPPPLPSVIHVEAVRDDVSYHLPVRPLGPLRWAGVVFAGVGVIFLWTPGAGLIAFLKRAFEGKAGADDWFGGLFGVPFLIGGLIPVALGLLILYGRCRVEWRQKRLSTLDFAGPLRWRRRLPKARVRKFTVKSGGAKVNDQPVTTGPLADLGALFAEFEEGKPRIVALGYPRDWLQALAENLSARLAATSSTVAAPAVELVDLSQSQPPVAEVAERPADSQVRLEPRPNGVLLIVPPAGLWKGSKGLFVVGVIWCSLMTVFAVMMVLGGTTNSNSVPWGAWIFIVIFWLIGGGILAGAIHLGRRRAMLLVENGTLSVAQAGLFGAKRWEWRREDLAAIRADASGMEVNDVPVIELQVHPAGGKKIGFFAGRDPQELRWMATELRRVLKMTSLENGDIQPE